MGNISYNKTVGLRVRFPLAAVPIYLPGGLALQELIRAIVQNTPKTVIKENEPLARYTSFKIGGPADLLLIPQSSADIPMLFALLYQYELPLHILGGGSNLLVSDQGVSGVVMKVSCGDVTWLGENRLFAGAGCLKASASVFAQSHGLSGLEFLHGIPGTVGGGIAMNAGAYGGELSQVVTLVTACDRRGDVMEIPAGSLAFGYRDSIFHERRELTVLGAEFSLIQDDPAVIRARMDDFMKRRRERQPLEYPSAGSTFKRPEGYYAGKLIEDSGLKGYTVGGACVSEKHAGFIVNRGGATCEDVRRVIEHVQRTVLHTFGVELVCEIEMW